MNKFSIPLVFNYSRFPQYAQMLGGDRLFDLKRTVNAVYIGDSLTVNVVDNPQPQRMGECMGYNPGLANPFRVKRSFRNFH